MKKLVVPALLVAGLSASLLVGVASVAYAAPPAGIYTPDPATGGVTQAAANAVCAAIVGKPAPSTTNEAAFRAAANTPTGTDDVGFEGKVVPEWQDLIVTQETHRDHLGAYGLDDSKTFRCDGAAAKLPKLVLAKDVQDAICASERLDLISKPAVKARVSSALGVLKRSYSNARLDCAPVVPPTTTPAPTTTPQPTTTPAPTTSPAPATTPQPPSVAPVDNTSDSGFEQVGSVPVGGVETGGGPA